VIVRCGRCGTEFQVPGPGRYTCPACGTANEVRGAGPEISRPEPPPAPEHPSPRVVCPACDFSFIVGSIEMATCPNCGEAVPVSGGEA
jgi:Zn finger protein HypA/HybF involved in hydrogenase expression